MGRRNALHQQKCETSDVGYRIPARRGTTKILGRNFVSLAQKRRRIEILPLHGVQRAGSAARCFGLQPQSEYFFCRNHRALVRLFPGSSRYRQAGKLRRCQHHFLRFEHPFPGGRKLPPQRGSRPDAYSQGCVLCPSGDVERLGGY